jgi:hypothetical protein
MSGGKTRKYLQRLKRRRDHLRTLSDHGESNSYDDSERVALTWAILFIERSIEETNAE